MKAFTGLSRLQLLASSLAAMLPAGTPVDGLDDFIPAVAAPKSARPSLSRNATKSGPGRMPPRRHKQGKPRYAAPSYGGPNDGGYRTLRYLTIREHDDCVKASLGWPAGAGRKGVYIAAVEQIHNSRSRA